MTATANTSATSTATSTKTPMTLAAFNRLYVYSDYSGTTGKATTYVIRDRDASPIGEGKRHKGERVFKTWDAAQKYMKGLRLEALKTAGKSARVRHVYPSDEIPHLWAHQTQDDARNANRNFYFEGPTIWSYGSHFPVASHVKNSKGKACVLLTTRTYSVTTAGHIRETRSAIPSSVKVFEVSCVLPRYGVDYHVGNLEVLARECRTQLDKARAARKYGQSSFDSALATMKHAREYAKFFGVACSDFSFMPTGKKLAELRATLAERKQRADKLDSEANTRAEARRAARAALEAKELPEKIAAWRSHSPLMHSLPWGSPTLLRLSKDKSEVETSRGARVPVSHALACIAMIKRVISRGVEYVRNGHTFHVGHFAVDRIETNGTAHIGCHVIPFEEVTRITPELEALVTPASPASDICNELGIN